MNELFKDKKYYASLDGLVSLDYDFFIAVEDYFEENLKSSKKKEKEKESIVKDYILSLLDSFEEVETQLENISTQLQETINELRKSAKVREELIDISKSLNERIIGGHCASFRNTVDDLLDLANGIHPI